MNRPRRVYKTAEYGSVAGGFAVLLDGKPLRTPAGAALLLPTAALAEAVAAEWRAQGEHVRPHTMPLTRLASTAIDRVGPLRAAVIEALLAFAETDALCYQAEAPADLAARQQAAWQPLRAWAEARWGVRLAVTCGVLPVAQDPDALARLRGAVEACDDLRLTALQAASAAAGSLIVALALIEGRLDAAAAFAVAHLEELHQVALWGEDAEAAARRDAVAADIAAAARFAALAV